MDASYQVNLTVECAAHTIRVLLVDDNSKFLASASRFLRMDPRIEVVGCATSGTQAVEQAALVQPDIIVMDLHMPGMNGLEAAQQIKAQDNPPCVILVTMTDTSEYRAAAQAAKINGFIPKSDFGTDIKPLLFKLYSY